MLEKILIAENSLLKVYIVDASIIRTYHNIYDIEFALGGHFYRYPFIPPGEIWLENTLNKYDLIAIFIHEFIEWDKMRAHRLIDLDYNSAHDFANLIENLIRDIYRYFNIL